MVDLLKELKKERDSVPEDRLVVEAKNLLKQDLARDMSVLNKLVQGKKGSTNAMLKELDQSMIFDLKHIKKLCIKYRFRFLSASLYAKEFPYEAILRVKNLEKEFGQSLSDFKLLAPKKVFRLTDKDSDPILFLKLSEDKYYFIHKWGGEISAFRALITYPLRNFMTMFWSLFVTSILFSLAIPTESFISFAFLAIHSFIAICGMACLFMFAFRENFSEAEWDSKHLS